MREVMFNGFCAAAMMIICFGFAGCSTAPVNRPCGVIEDSLKDVQGKTQADNMRIDRHHARGVGAGCWQ